MGIRLYPNTTNPAALERMAEVPAGTAALLAEKEKEFDMDKASATKPMTFHERMAATDRWYEFLYAPGNEALNAYHGFLISGWGKFNGGDVATGEAGAIDWDKDEDAWTKILWLLSANGILVSNLELCRGVHWC